MRGVFFWTVGLWSALYRCAVLAGVRSGLRNNRALNPRHLRLPQTYSTLVHASSTDEDCRRHTVASRAEWLPQRPSPDADVAVPRQQVPMPPAAHQISAM